MSQCSIEKKSTFLTCVLKQQQADLTSEGGTYMVSWVWSEIQKELHSRCHFCPFDLLPRAWKRAQPKRHKLSAIGWTKTRHRWQAVNLAGDHFSRPDSLPPPPPPVLLGGLLTCHSGHSAAPGGEDVIKVLFGREDRNLRGQGGGGGEKKIKGGFWPSHRQSLFAERENGVEWGGGSEAGGGGV